MLMPDTNQSAQGFWDEIYRNTSAKSAGRPSAVLQRFTTGRNPGMALDLGCAKGDDAVWLARQGWQVTAIDVSPTVLGYARANAARNGVEDRIDFQRHDLAESFPDLRSDLVSAMFLQTPLDFPRLDVLRRAAATLRPGGLLLIVSHGSRAPWSWADPGAVFPTARQSLDEFEFAPSAWAELFVGASDRVANGPNGQTATVTDTILALERR